MEMQSDAPNAWQAVQPVELEEVLVDEDPQQAVQPVEFEEVLVDDDPQQVPPTSRDELSRQFLPPVATEATTHEEAPLPLQMLTVDLVLRWQRECAENDQDFYFASGSHYLLEQVM
ncbi:unnamed protein product [Durusdinium trenchii]